MTIDEMIEKIKNDPNYIKNQEDITFGIKYSEEMENIRLIYKGISDAYILTHNILFKLIKELNKVNQELVVYKKALKLACWDTMCNCLHDDYYNDLLQKAREQQ